MARPAKSQFVCQNCGAVAPRWAGKCVACGEWNTLIEEADVAAPPGSGLTRSSKGRVVELETLTQTTDKMRVSRPGTPSRPRHRRRHRAGLRAADRGEPGIGKSTLLLQLAAAFASADRRHLFLGEEAAAQKGDCARRASACRRPRWRSPANQRRRHPHTLAEGEDDPTSSWSTPSRRCGPTLEAAPGRSTRCAPPRDLSSDTPRRRAPPSCSSATSPGRAIAGPR